ATRPPLRASPALLPTGATREGAINLAEGRGFEPPRDLRPYPISSRTPSTGLGHPSALPIQHATRLFAVGTASPRKACPTEECQVTPSGRAPSIPFARSGTAAGGRLHGSSG